MIRQFNILSALLLIGSAPAQTHDVATLNEQRSELVIGNSTPIEHYSVRWKKGGSSTFSKRTLRTAPEEVWLTGQLIVKDDAMDDVELLIAVENGECREARIRKSGRFDIVLAAGSKARLTFQKPDHIAKEILVDATNVNKDLIGRGEDRKVKFDVILVPDDAYPGLVHDGPVGSITFRRGSSALKVDHHERLVAADRVCKLNK